MTPKEYYNSTRAVETKNWTLGMVFSFAEEYHKAESKFSVSKQSNQLFCPSCGAKNWDRVDGMKRCLECNKHW